MERCDSFGRIVHTLAFFLLAACSDSGVAKTPANHDAGPGETKTERAVASRWTMYGHDLSNTQADEGAGLVQDGITAAREERLHLGRDGGYPEDRALL